MPQLDPYDTQTSISLLRQHKDYEHWYDRNKLSLKHIKNTQYTACMNPSAWRLSAVLMMGTTCSWIVPLNLEKCLPRKVL